MTLENTETLSKANIYLAEMAEAGPPYRDPEVQAHIEVIRARSQMVRCNYCEHFHRLEECRTFKALPCHRKHEFMIAQKLCRLCLGEHDYFDCPDRGMEHCQELGCYSPQHHQILHCSKGESLPEEGQQDPETVPREVAVARAEALKRALEKLESLKGIKDTPRAAPSYRRPFAAFMANCMLCKDLGKELARHELGHCPGFLRLGLSAREQIVGEFACVFCLSVEHYSASCLRGKKECGINGCRLPHHPLLHRIQYVEPLSHRDDAVFNWPRHQQARKDGAEENKHCTVCNDSHSTRACAFWPQGGFARIRQAMHNYVCTKCLGEEHQYCPAEEIICGIDGCAMHHDPFFHEGEAKDPVQGQLLPDSWKLLQEAYCRRTQRMEAAYCAKRLNYRLEHSRLADQLADCRPKDYIRGNDRNVLPAYRYRYNELGEVVMTRRTFLYLSGTQEQYDKLCRHSILFTLHQSLRKMDPYLLEQVLAEELAMDPRDPARLRKIERRVGEPDDEYHFRVAKRVVALELYPPTQPNPDQAENPAENDTGAIGPEVPDQEPNNNEPGSVAPAPQQGATGWTTTEDDDGSISDHYHGEYEDNGWSSDEDMPQVVPTAPPRDRPRPVLSGNPFEGSSEDTD